MDLLALRGVEKGRFQTLLKREKLNVTNEVRVDRVVKIISWSAKK